MIEPRTILITGASSGLGAALALHYARPGIALYLSGRNPDRLEQVAADCRGRGAKAERAVLDVTDRMAMEAWILAVDAQKPIDLAIANAGISSGSHKGEEESSELMRAVFATNVDGVLNTILPLLPRMQERGRGQIAIMSSLAGFRGFGQSPAYCASKAAERVLGEGLRLKMQPHGVKVSVICPGFVRTPMTDRNKFRMPFLMDARQAAQVIGLGLALDKGRISFPMPLAFAVWLLSFLPVGMSDILLGIRKR
ncbi:MAG: SDR family NAD(P)-dependent oxidoreductase [Rhodospirillales bacterium]|jgi:NADP-dependent 3-hydroxy acid dehydrogenase YdfG|nr:SDR family NAD(P)-dependent oxidoreductase [Rhodospirillales bacterium]